MRYLGLVPITLVGTALWFCLCWWNIEKAGSWVLFLLNGWIIQEVSTLLGRLRAELSSSLAGQFLMFRTRDSTSSLG